MDWKKLAKRTAVSVLLCLAVRTTWLIVQRESRRAAGDHDYAAAVAETEETDPDWRWDELAANRHRPPPGKNGADLIPRIKGLIPTGWGQKLNDEKWEPLATVPTNARFPEEVLAEARRECEAAAPAIELARSLRDYPEGHRDLHLAPLVVNTPLADTQSTRLVAVLLKWDTVLAVERGDLARTADSLHAMLNASRSVGDEPFLISQLVRIAARVIAARSLERTLAQTELTANLLGPLQAAWTTDAEAPLLLFGLRGERAAWDTLVGNLADGTAVPDDLNGLARGTGVSFGGYAWWLYRGRLSNDRAYLHRYFTRAVAVARLPIHQQPQAVKGLPDPPDEDLRLAQLFLPAVEKVGGAHWRSVAEARCTIVGMACERFRLRNGRWPGTLAELPRELLAEVPLDPFDGQPLRYKHLPDGVVIYSLGRNGTDEGGTLARSGSPEGKDVGFRLWDPAHRRQQAPTRRPEAPVGERDDAR
ncbi:MAG: hypothetical protein JWO38_6494 [Gemmataceae bacterium]|nr:hypothetical protein [Gemmataceae bacterium]